MMRSLQTAICCVDNLVLKFTGVAVLSRLRSVLKLVLVRFEVIVEGHEAPVRRREPLPRRVRVEALPVEVHLHEGQVLIFVLRDEAVRVHVVVQHNLCKFEVFFRCYLEILKCFYMFFCKILQNFAKLCKI